MRLIAGLLGLIFLIIAVIYFIEPAGSLPSFLPGFEAGSSHVHTTHGVGSLVAAIVLFAVAWFTGGSDKA